jgi:O-antigen ligase
LSTPSTPSITAAPVGAAHTGGPGGLAGRSRAWTLGAVAAGGAGAAAAAGIAPFIILSTVLLLACGAGVLHSPLVFLWIITAISGIGLGWTDAAALDIAGHRINVNGLHWALVIVTCVVVLVRAGVAPVPRALRGWLAFAALALLGVLWAPDRFEAVKQSLLYVAPLLTAIVITQTVSSARDVALLRIALYAAAVLGLLVAIPPALAGDLLGGSFDPEGRLLHRAFGTFMLPIMALALARLRYGDAPQGIVVLILFGLALSTLSRTTLAAMILLATLAMAGTPWRLRATLAGLVLVFGVAAYQYEPVRERIFADQRRGFTARVEVSGQGQEAQLHVAGLQLTGRGPVWIQTYWNALRAPWLGHGTGSATKFVAERTRGGALFPHNEYLRVFHDLGIAGLAALFTAFGMVLIALRRLQRSAATRTTRELALAGLLCWSAFVLISLFDNPLGYFVFFTHNVFLLTALAFRSAQLEQVT